MKTIERYLARQIYASVAFVMAGFLALFGFFDLVNELGDLGVGNYNLREILTYVALSVPAHAYELFPVAVLIGTLYVLAYLASNSEYTVMRAAGFSPANAGWILVKIGFAFVALTFVLGEWAAPLAEEAAQTLREMAEHQRRAIRGRIVEATGLDREALQELATATRWTLGPKDRRALLLLLQLGNASRDVGPYVSAVEYAGE